MRTRGQEETLFYIIYDILYIISYIWECWVVTLVHRGKTLHVGFDFEQRVDHTANNKLRIDGRSQNKLHLHVLGHQGHS